MCRMSLRTLRFTFIAIAGLVEYVRTLLYMERKCADTVGTVLVPAAGHFRC